MKMDLELFSRMLSSSESLENIVTSKLNRTKSCQGLGGTDRKRRGSWILRRTTSEVKEKKKNITCEKKIIFFLFVLFCCCCFLKKKIEVRERERDSRLISLLMYEKF